MCVDHFIQNKTKDITLLPVSGLKTFCVYFTDFNVTVQADICEKVGFYLNFYQLEGKKKTRVAWFDLPRVVGVVGQLEEVNESSDE